MFYQILLGPVIPAWNPASFEFCAVALIAGILILVMPRLLNYIVALYLIVVGLLGLFPHLAG